ncbi:acetyl-CoA carboxylase carboxyl transferase subunit alpha, partial [Pandoraea pneumonica]
MKTLFDFEKPIDDLVGQLDKVKQVAEKTQVDMSATISELEAELKRTREQIYGNMTGWQKVQMSRHPDRPQTLDYIS